MSTEDNKAVIHRIVDGLNQKEVAVLDELYTPDFVSHDPANPQVRSREDFKQWFTGCLRPFPIYTSPLRTCWPKRTGWRIALPYVMAKSPNSGQTRMLWVWCNNLA